MTNRPSAATFARQADRYLGVSYRDLDCQALVEAMLRDVGVQHNWRGSNAMYRDMAWVGSPEECLASFGAIPAGALLFILENDGGEPDRYRSDGVGNASHVGVKTGSGKGAVHASASRGCVCESVFRDRTIPNGGWNRIGLCGLLDYGPAFTKGETMSEIIKTAVVTAESGSTVNMRDKPNGRRVERVPVGTEVPVSGSQDGWSRIAYNGQSGWMMSQYLRLEGQQDDTESSDVWDAINDLTQRLAAAEDALEALGWSKADGGFG